MEATLDQLAQLSSTQLYESSMDAPLTSEEQTTQRHIFLVRSMNEAVQVQLPAVGLGRPEWQKFFVSMQQRIRESFSGTYIISYHIISYHVMS